MKWGYKEQYIKKQEWHMTRKTGKRKIKYKLTKTKERQLFHRPKND